MKEPDQIEITVNGIAKALPRSFSITELMQHLEMTLPHLAVALNEEVVPRSMHSKTSVQNGDRVEILRAVAGG